MSDELTLPQKIERLGADADAVNAWANGDETTSVSFGGTPTPSPRKMMHDLDARESAAAQAAIAAGVAAAANSATAAAAAAQIAGDGAAVVTAHAAALDLVAGNIDAIQGTAQNALSASESAKQAQLSADAAAASANEAANSVLSLQQHLLLEYEIPVTNSDGKISILLADIGHPGMPKPFNPMISVLSSKSYICSLTSRSKLGFDVQLFNNFGEKKVDVSKTHGLGLVRLGQGKRFGQRNIRTTATLCFTIPNTTAI